MKIASFFTTILCLSLSTSSLLASEPDKLKKCQVCHGKQLTGKKKSPTIVGLSFEELMASLTTDVPKKMKRVAGKLTEQEKTELSRYISNLQE